MSLKTDIKTVAFAVGMMPHSSRCEGWYCCNCGVAKAEKALERLVAAVEARREIPAVEPPKEAAP